MGCTSGLAATLKDWWLGFLTRVGSPPVKCQESINSAVIRTAMVNVRMCVLLTVSRKAMVDLDVAMAQESHGRSTCRAFMRSPNVPVVARCCRHRLGLIANVRSVPLISIPVRNAPGLTRAVNLNVRSQFLRGLLPRMNVTVVSTLRLW